MVIDLCIALSVINTTLLLWLLYMHFNAQQFGFGSERIERLTLRNTLVHLELIRITRHIYKKFYGEEIPLAMPGELTEALNGYEEERPDRPPY